MRWSNSVYGVWLICILITICVTGSCGINMENGHTHGFNQVETGRMEIQEGPTHQIHSDKLTVPVTPPASPSSISVHEPTASEWDRLFTSYRTKFKRNYKTPSIQAEAFEAFKKHHLKTLELNALHSSSKTIENKSVVFNTLSSPLGDKTDAELHAHFFSGPPALNAAHHAMVKKISTPPTATQTTSASNTHSKIPSKHRFSQLRRWQQIPPGRSVLAPRTLPSTSKSTKFTPPIPSPTPVPSPPISPQSPQGQPIPVEAGDNGAKRRSGGDNGAKRRSGGGDDGGNGGDNYESDSIGSWSPQNTQFQSLTGIQPTLDGTAWIPPIVRAQGQCKSCWATVAVEHFQALIAVASVSAPISGTAYPRLSIQQVIDCQRSAFDQGCTGGTVTGAFDFMQQHGVSTSSIYQYLQDGTQHTCGTSLPYDSLSGQPAVNYKAPPSLFFTPPCLDTKCQPIGTAEASLLTFWSKPQWRTSNTPVILPMIAYVDATNWVNYVSGIFPAQQCSSTGANLNHVVQIVGYGSDNGHKYWLVRNSWGGDWGEAGHIRLPFGVNACGLFNVSRSRSRQYSVDVRESTMTMSLCVSLL